MVIGIGLALCWVLAVLAIGWCYRKEIQSVWAEPVVRFPVLIVESDDWGPGPQIHAERLAELQGILGKFHDGQGRCPVMTLGVVLAVPDRVRLRESGCSQYHRVTLAHQRYSEIRSVILDGMREGVFSLQLHGMEHFWPPALITAAVNNQSVKEWLEGDDENTTERLPSFLQSRWVDASQLPSVPIPDKQIQPAVHEEAELFAKVFSKPPRVIVPPTFVWDARVEAAWSKEGLGIVVTPGRRYETHEADGSLHSVTDGIRNGQAGSGGLMYIVRDEYFEPMLGHTAERCVDALVGKTILGRPTLVEMHRANFIGDRTTAERAIEELRRLLSVVVERVPNTRFMSTEELASAISTLDPNIIESSMAVRTSVFLRRLQTIHRFRTIALVTGLVLFAWLLRVVTGWHKKDPTVGSQFSATP